MDYEIDILNEKINIFEEKENSDIAQNGSNKNRILEKTLFVECVDEKRGTIVQKYRKKHDEDFFWFAPRIKEQRRKKQTYILVFWIYYIINCEN